MNAAHTQAARQALLASPQPLCRIDVHDCVIQIEDAMDAHHALASLVGHCMQHLNGCDDNTPVSPRHMGALLQAVNAQVQQHVNALKTLCQQANAS